MSTQIQVHCISISEIAAAIQKAQEMLNMASSIIMPLLAVASNAPDAHDASDAKSDAPDVKSDAPDAKSDAPDVKSDAKSDVKSDAPDAKSDAKSDAPVKKCIWIFSKGKDKKGQQCGVSVKNGSDYCRKHTPKDKSAPKKTASVKSTAKTSKTTTDTPSIIDIIKKSSKTAVAPVAPVGSMVDSMSADASSSSPSSSSPSSGLASDDAKCQSHSMDIVKMGENWVHSSSNFVFKSENEPVVIGKHSKHGVLTLTDRDIQLCKQMNLEYEMPIIINREEPIEHTKDTKDTNDEKNEKTEDHSYTNEFIVDDTFDVKNDEVSDNDDDENDEE